MSFLHSWRACPIAVAMLTAAAPPPPDPAREQLMARLDAAGDRFQRMSARVKQVSYTKVIDDTSEQEGSIRIQKVRPGEIEGLVEFTNPDHKYYLFEKRTLDIYTPKIDTLQEIDLGQHGEELDQFLSIGFGTTGRELAKSYQVDVASGNTVAGTTLVRLTPTAPEVKKYLSRIDLWLSDQGYPVQEKLTEPSGDWVTVYYSAVSINPVLPPNSFKLPIKPTTKKEYPAR